MPTTANLNKVANTTNFSNLKKTHKVNTILVTLDQKQQYITANFPSPVKLGETVRCHTDTVGATVEIYFDVNGSPFGTAITEIDSNDPPLELKVPSPPNHPFIGRCYMTTSDGVVHRYPPGGRQGGDMIVR